LSSIKSVDGDLTLLHFLEEMISVYYPEVAGFEMEINHVEAAAKMSREDIQKAIKDMETNLSKLKPELESCGDSNDPEDKFKEVMSEFYNKATEQCGKLVEMFDNMTNKFKDLAEYYCFELENTEMNTFFCSLSSFLQEYKTAKKENIKRKEREKKETQAKERA
ncbi:diaphanous homolog 2-like, partial [Paramuricea clavata]